MLNVKNIDEAFAKIDAWLDEVEREIVDIAIGMTWTMTGQVLNLSPQYSGDFAANWRMSVNKIDTTFQPGVFPEMQFPADAPFQRGDAPAILHAIKANDGRLNGAKLGDTLWLANSAEHHDLYAWKLEDGFIKLRPVNYGGEGPLRQAKKYMQVHFSTINKTNREFLK